MNRCKCVNKNCSNYNNEFEFEGDTTYREFSDTYEEFVLVNKCPECNSQSIVLLKEVNLNEMNFINKGASKQIDDPKQARY